MIKPIQLDLEWTVDVENLQEVVDGIKARTDNFPDGTEVVSRVIRIVPTSDLED